MGVDTVGTFMADCLLRLENLVVVTSLPFKHFCVVSNSGLAMAEAPTTRNWE
jgi:hypothetical protein